MSPPVLEITKKVAKSVGNITTKLCETLQPGCLCLTASRYNQIQTGYLWTSDMARRATLDKHISKLLATMHAYMVCLLMYLLNGDKSVC